MSDYSYIGSGKIKLKEVGAATGLIEVGNCSALNYSVAEDIKELKDYTQPGGGTYNEVRRIQAVEISFTAHDLSAANLARALFGDASSVTGNSVTGESVTAKLGATVELAHPNPSAVTIATFTEGTDYEVTPAGLYFYATGGITNDQVLSVDYTYPDYDVVEALTNSAKEYEILFEGLNEARSGKPVIVKTHRAKLGAAQNIDWIGDDFVALEVSGKVLKDTSKTGGISQYFKTTIVV